MAITDYELGRRRAERGNRISGQVTEHANGYYVRSETHSAKTYSVAVKDGVWLCDCDDHRYRAEPYGKVRPFHCKHIQAVLFALEYGRLHGTKSIERSRQRAGVRQRGAPRRRGPGSHSARY
jgi:hypothetical protein